MRISAALDRLAQELRHAARRLVRSPGFTAATVLTIALAIAANAAIFAVVHRVLLNPLPYGESHRLVALEHSRKDVASIVSTVSSRIFFQYADRARTLEGVALYESSDLTLTGAGEPERIRGARTTPSLAPVLRAQPARGRWFGDDDAVPGAPLVVVLSHGLWARRFGSDSAILGRVLTFDGVPVTVVGVMPASFQFPDPATEWWVPFPLSRATANDSYGPSAIARLRGGAAVADARAELTQLLNALEPAHPNNGYARLMSIVTPLIDATVGRVATALWTLLASVGVVLLVACANVANLFLVRSEARQREIAVRRALGAGGGSIARYFLTESALLAAAGSAFGLGLAWGAVRVLVAAGPATLPRLGEVRIDAVVVAFTGAMALLTAALCGAIPLARVAPLAVSLTESGRGNTASRGRHRTRRLLMAGQVAMAMVLLVASGLMLRSVQKLRAADPGFDPESALTFRIGLPREQYGDRAAVAAAHRRTIDRLAQLPGVTSVSAANLLPLSFFGTAGPLFVEGHVLPTGAAAPVVASRIVAGGYFETMGMRIVRGRGIDRRDVERGDLVAVVNEAAAAVAFGSQDPTGQRIRLGNPALARGAVVWLTIAGVVRNTPIRGLTEAAPVPAIYIPMFARDIGFGPRADTMSYVVRTASPPSATTPAVRAAIAEVDPDLALSQVRTLQEILDRASAQMAFTMVLLATAAAVALALGVVGIYGVTSYIVSQRTGEIGVRLALGARPAGVAAMIVREGAAVALAGVLVGLAAAAAGGRVIESLLYGVSPRDPGVLVATTLALVAVSLLACWLPARRAARLSPLDALRSE